MTHEILTMTDLSSSVVQIELNRPERKNALSIELAKAVTHALHACSLRTEIKIVVLRGAGHCFSAGGDLKDFHQNLSDAEKLFFEVSTHLNEAILQIQAMPQTVIAAIEGPAYAAGFGLALACDLLVASQSAKLSPSFSNIALSPNAGTTYFLSRILGPKRALEAFQRAQVFPAIQALQLGLLNQVWPDDEFESSLQSYLTSLLDRPLSACSRAKALVQNCFERSLSEQLELERQHISHSSTHDDFAAGVTAFVQKKKPRFNS